MRPLATEHMKIPKRHCQLLAHSRLQPDFRLICLLRLKRKRYARKKCTVWNRRKYPILGAGHQCWLITLRFFKTYILHLDHDLDNERSFSSGDLQINFSNNTLAWLPTSTTHVFHDQFYHQSAQNVFHGIKITSSGWTGINIGKQKKNWNRSILLTWNRLPNKFRIKMLQIHLTTLKQKCTKYIGCWRVMAQLY